MRHLQSMKQIEDDAANRFQTETLDLRNFTPQYPNVIVVDQRAPEDGTEPVRRVKHGKPQVLPHIHKMPHKRLFVSHSLSKAMGHVVVEESGFIHSGSIAGEGWTLLLKEGLYVDPWLSLSLVEFELNPDCQVEIVGLNDVRILTLNDEKCCAFAGKWCHGDLNLVLGIRGMMCGTVVGCFGLKMVVFNWVNRRC